MIRQYISRLMCLYGLHFHLFYSRRRCGSYQTLIRYLGRGRVPHFASFLSFSVAISLSIFCVAASTNGYFPRIYLKHVRELALWNDLDEIYCNRPQTQCAEYSTYFACAPSCSCTCTYVYVCYVHVCARAIFQNSLYLPRGRHAYSTYFRRY